MFPAGKNKKWNAVEETVERNLSKLRAVLGREMTKPEHSHFRASTSVEGFLKLVIWIPYNERTHQHRPFKKTNKKHQLTNLTEEEKGVMCEIAKKVADSVAGMQVTRQFQSTSGQGTLTFKIGPNISK